MCEAERRNQQALYELTIQHGNGVIDLGRLRTILTGPCDHEKDGASYTQNT